jgi:hypothetical protein
MTVIVERDLCMADPPAACSCGRCVLRSRLTNREVAAIEVERDRALDHLEGAVEALERYGFHHGDCPAILVDDPGPCGCGWSDTAASLRLFGGQ